MTEHLGTDGKNHLQRLASLRRPLAAIALCCSVAVSLQGCVEMMVGGAVMGSLAATDRRTFGAQTEDKTIVFKGESRVSKLIGEAGHVNVNSFNRKVLLTGEVRDEAMKAAVEREINAIENVASVVNELEIAGVSSFSSRSNDTLITGKVKAAFVDAKDLFANSIKVVTERGNVYLMGLVTQTEGARAAEVTRNVGGVQKVIKVFDYITEDELRQLSTTQDKQTAR
ncbi:BON domain-containing protein [Oxalobacteraceae bacterium R-40]|uniref:BON domain-containing protein n=1 Tax=Keguizhuia sedimenti TaxID=3064264 RepID=A0ABU1BLH8_9BURK|nr:BON domain-containing protein [Oxalobacteraceae bacterium R-40]